MIKFFCDRCGKETKFDETILDSIGRALAKLVNKNDSYTLYKNDAKVYLCKDCQNNLVEWLKGADK